MAQVLTQKPHNKANATAGGIRLYLRETKSNSPGWDSVGNIHSPDFQALVEFFEHYSASSGRDVRDYDLISQLGYKLSFTADEILLANLRRQFYAAEHTDVAANATATGGPDTWVAGKTGSRSMPEFPAQSGAQRTALAVYNVTDSALLVENTDYKKLSEYGLTVIELLVDTHAGDTLRVGTGATANTAYNWVQLASRRINPLSQPKIEGKAFIQFPASQGINLGWRVPSMILKPDGSIDWNKKESSSMKFTMEWLDDSVANPTTPFGYIDYYGYDDAGVPLI